MAGGGLPPGGSASGLGAGGGTATAISTGCCRWRSPGYLRALARYRAALAQRNAALRQDGRICARAFDAPLADAGAEVTRIAAGLGLGLGARLERGTGRSRRDRRRSRSPTGATRHWPMPRPGPAAAGRRPRPRPPARRDHVGPHRDDLRLTLGGRSLRDFGSTGQQRSAAIALKLLERSNADVEPHGTRRRSCWTTSSPSWTASGRSGWPRG